jgi:predicted nucleic acid-binding protein
VFKENILEFTNIIKTTNKISYIKDDADDDKILECAISAESDYIISGDKHLIKLKSFRNIKILKPADFLISIK